MSNSFVQTLNFKSAHKLLDSLSPRQDRWAKEDDANHWIFRGQRDEWPLIPSAARDEAWKKFGCAAPSGNEDRLRWEFCAVALFANEADRHGLPVPGFDHTWIEFKDVTRKFDDVREVFAGRDFFPKKEWCPLFGMAQHHGVPTRLLDWSESPLIAAYFAARGADDTPRRKHIQVSALN